MELRPPHRSFVFGLFLVAATLLALVVAPFVGAVFAAAVLAAVTSGWQSSLTRRLGGRATLAAGLLTTALVIAVLFPIAILTRLAALETMRLAEWAAEALEREGTQGVLLGLPEGLRKPAAFVLDRLPGHVTGHADSNAGASVPSTLSAIGSAAGLAGRLVGRSLDLLLQIGVMLAAYFCLSSEGHRVVAYFVDLLPLERSKSLEILARLQRVATGVFSSTFLTAAIQALVALVGYAIAGVESIWLVTLLTFVFAFVPALGAAAVTLAAAAIVWLSGSPGLGVFLGLWGILAVGMIDNVVKPLLARGDLQLPASLIFFSMLGGMTVFGPLGLIAGPMIVSLFLMSAQLVRHECTSGRAREGMQRGDSALGAERGIAQ